MRKCLIGILSIVSVTSREEGKVQTYTLPKISFEDLLTVTPSVGTEIKNSLSAIGGLQIVDIPGFKNAREMSLNHLAACLEENQNNQEEIIESSMKDGKKRLTIATSTKNDGTLQEMNSICGEPSWKLRNIIDFVSLQLFKTMDQAFIEETHNKVLMKPSYRTFQELFKNGEHLEHLHSYYSSKPSQESSQDFQKDDFEDFWTMPFHTDSGMLIAMTEGFFSLSHASNQANNLQHPRNGLFIELPSGERREAITETDSLIIMIGQGGSDWIETSSTISLRAFPHALRFDSTNNGWTRSWYGKMFLPPKDAILSESSETYENYRNKELELSRNLAVEDQNSENLPSACEQNLMKSSKKHLKMPQNELCNHGKGVYCWMQCYPFQNYSCGKEVVCVDDRTNEIVSGSKMCPFHDDNRELNHCHLQCPETPASSSAAERSSNNSSKTMGNNFCYGMGVSMFMDGFNSQLSSDGGSVPCLNLFFKDWTLNQSYKYCLGCFGVIGLGMFVEYLSVLRKRLYLNLTESSSKSFVLVALHSLQTALNYFLMLAAMTYSVEMFCMVLIGVAAGYAVFNLQLHSRFLSPSSSSSSSRSNEYYQVPNEGSLEL